MTARIARLFIVAALLWAFVSFAWPTRWRYDSLTIGSDTYPVRIDRLTGHADVLLPGDAWTPIEEVTDQSQDESDQPGLRRT